MSENRVKAMKELLERRATSKLQKAPDATFSCDTPVFLYGSLMHPDVLKDALGVDLDSLPAYRGASLSGYSRFKVVGASFPAIVPQESGRVDGAVIQLENDAQLLALDSMERVLYSRETVSVNIEEGGTVEAFAYVWKGDADELSTEPWDLESFSKMRESVRHD